MSLRYVRSNRDCGAADLAGHPVHLVLREARRQPVYLFGHRHRLLPHLEVAVRADSDFSASSYSLFTLSIRYSLLTIRSLDRSFGLLVAGQRHVAGALPWRQEIEITEFLGEPHLVVDDALLLIVV